MIRQLSTRISNRLFQLPYQHHHHKMHILDLPTELLGHIFALARNPKARLTCRHFHHLSLSPVVRADFLTELFTNTQNEKIRRAMMQACGGSLPQPNDMGRRLGFVLVNALSVPLLSGDVVRVLVRQGADVMFSENLFFRWSCANGRRGFVELFLTLMKEHHHHHHRYRKQQDGQDGQNEFSVTMDEDYALRVAAQNGHLDIVEVLLGSGARVESKSHHALRLAAQQGHVEIVMRLLDGGSDISVDNHFITRHFSAKGDTAVVRELVARGADVRAEEDEALVLACVHGHLSTARYLVEAGCRVDARQNMPLQAACKHQQWEIARWLVEEMRVDVSCHQHVYLRTASEHGRWDMVEQAIGRINMTNDRTAMSNDRNESSSVGVVVLERAIASAQPSIVRALLEAGVRPTHVKRDALLKLRRQSGTPAAREVYRILKQHGIALDAETMRHMSSLSSLSSSSSSKLVRPQSKPALGPSNGLIVQGRVML